MFSIRVQSKQTLERAFYTLPGGREGEQRDIQLDEPHKDATQS